MEKQNIFDIYFVNNYGVSAEKIGNLSESFGNEETFEAMMMAKQEENMFKLRNHIFMDWDYFSAFEKTQMILIIENLRYDVFAEAEKEVLEKLFYSEEKGFLFAPHLWGTIALFVQKEIDEKHLELVKEICAKANIEVVYKKYNASDYE